MDNFENMLNELYNNLNQTNKVISVTLPEPQLIKNGHNIIWKNVKEFLKITNRPPDHFTNYLTKDCNCQINWITDSKSDGLIFNQQKIKNSHIINFMKIYLKEFVICKSCKSYKTMIVKDNAIRKYNFICSNCKNEYYI
jgi:translation initiation factor 2 subunit 2